MRDIFVLAILVSLYPLVLASPFVGTQVYAWLGFLVPYKHLWTPLPITWVAITAAITLVGWLVSREPKNVLAVPIIPIVLLYWLWTTITLQFALAPAPGYEKWVEFSKVALMCAVTAVMLTSRERIHAMVWMFVLAFLFYALRGTIVTVLAPAINVIGAPDTPWANTNGVARAFVMVAPLAYYLAFHSAHRYVRWGMLVVVACCGLALLGTNSRGGWVAGLAAGLYFLLRSKHRVRLAAGGLTLGLVLFLVVPDARWSNATERLDTVEQYEADSSAQQRFDVWRFAWSLALSRPVVGGGFEVFTLPLGRETVLAAHSNYFEALGEHGFPGFALYLGLVFASWFSCYRIEKLAKQHHELYWARDLAIMLKVGLTGYLVGGLFINFAHNPLFYSYIAIIGGTLLTVRREAVRLGLVPAPRRSTGRAQNARGARTLPAE